MRSISFIASAVLMLLEVTSLAEGQTLRAERLARTTDPVPVLSRPARLSISDAALVTALSKLSESSGVGVAFSPSLLRGEERTVNCACATLTVEETLERLLQGTSLSYSELDGQVVIRPLIAPPPHASAEPSAIYASLDSRLDPQWFNDLLASPDAQRSVALRRLHTVPAGPVAGAVRDPRSSPIPSARVAIVGSKQQVLTDALGNFRFEGVTGTEVVLQVTIIGFRPLTDTVVVGKTDLVLVLTPAAISLDEIVVTGTAGGIEKRALGNSISTINAAGLADRVAPPTDITRLINARAPGVLFVPNSGSVGNGGRIRLRGGSSFSLSLEPLIYVDGVRMDNRTGTGPGTSRDPGSPGIYPSISRLNDINADDIERVEIIKGPAAATLYGTEAANGVIQIFTKRGVAGAAKWSLSSTAGENWISNPEGRWRQIYRTRADGSVYHFNLIETENARGTPIFRNAPLTRNALGVSGGSEVSQYYVGASYNNEQGVLAPNQLRRFSGDANIQSQVNQKLAVTATFHYNTGRTTVVEENVTGGLSTVGSLNIPFRIVDPATDPIRGFNTAPPEDWKVFDFNQGITRYTMSLQTRYQPWSWLNTRVTLGRDGVYEENVTQNERLSGPAAIYWPQVANGRRNVQNVQNVTTSLDFAGTAAAHVSSSLGSKTSGGFQFYRKQRTGQVLDGQNFPSVGLEVVSAAALTTVDESYVRNTTVGMYAEQQVSWKDRIFLTGGIRADDNSAFGAEFNLVTYPKFSGSWVISEEPFFRSVPLISTLKLRSAFGASGQQPDAFSALRTYVPILGPGDVPAVKPDAPGNVNLGPERSEELEAGFETALFQDRVSVDFTYYNKHTRDLIINRSQPPSSGFPGSQVANLGETKATGLEAQMNTAILRGQNLGWDIGFNLSRNNVMVVSVGPDLPTAGGANGGTHYPGFPIGAYFMPKILSADVVNGQVVNVMCDAGGGKDFTYPSGTPIACDPRNPHAAAPYVYVGKPLPTWEGAFTTNLTLFKRLTFSGLLDFKLGMTAFDNATYTTCVTVRECEINFYPESNPLQAARMLDPGNGSRIPVNRNFAKLRELSVAYLVPEPWLRRLGVRSARVSLTGRELYTWKGSYEGPDPELVTATETWYYQVFHNIPQPTQFLASVKLTF